jgi:NAD(P)H-dependent flavin oxidoreductase YrpB (nitropropane dioxygenase family)
VVAQGSEAGGHVRGDVSTLVLVPRVVDAISPTPVIASGGIADGRGLVAVLALGAQAGVLGTRFLASHESRAHPRYKELLVQATEQDTALTTLFGVGWPHAPHRALRTPFVEKWRGDEARGQVGRPEDPVVGRTVVAGRDLEVREFVCFPPNRDASGDVESMGMLAGQCVGAIDSIKPAAEIVREIAAEAQRLERRLNETRLKCCTPTTASRLAIERFSTTCLKAEC